MAAPLFDRLTVVGCGLIGGSIVRAARRAGAAATIVVAERGPALERVRELGIADVVTGDLAEAVRDADLVIFATPPAAIGAAAEAAAPGLKPGAIVSDTGSVKAAVAAALAEACRGRGVHVVPGHPIAGTEHSGPDAGFAELFDGRWTILTPQASDDPAYDAATGRLAAFWEALGARVERMEAEHHDLVLAVTSHLPHLIAYNIVGTAADLEQVTQAEVMKYSAGGFRDFTRIAASDPVMWRDVFVMNKEAVLDVLGRFTEDLQALSRAIRWGEADKLEDLFTRTRAIRLGIIEAGQEVAAPNFGRDRK